LAGFWQCNTHIDLRFPAAPTIWGSLVTRSATSATRLLASIGQRAMHCTGSSDCEMPARSTPRYKTPCVQKHQPSMETRAIMPSGAALLLRTRHHPTLAHTCRQCDGFYMFTHRCPAAPLVIPSRPNLHPAPAPVRRRFSMGSHAQNRLRWHTATEPLRCGCLVNTLPPSMTPRLPRKQACACAIRLLP